MGKASISGDKQPSPEKLHRIQYMDGLRGVAIFWVMLYHAYCRWPEIVPYAKEFSRFPLFVDGWLGVYLFFLISGYVIFMTLDKSQSMADFFFRRWLRLFPAMLICSLIVYFTAAFFFERPAGSPHLRDLLPGLTFIEPVWWGTWLSSPQGQLEGAFWSLYVEVKFYLLAGFFYFLAGKKKTLWIFFLLFLFSVAVHFLRTKFPHLNWYVPQQILAISSARFFGWFTAGALFYLYTKERNANLLFLAIAIGLAAALSLNQEEIKIEFRPIYTTIGVVLLFTAAILNKKIQSWLTNPLLLIIGFASYPLYLLHENMMVSLIVKTGNFAPWMPALLFPVIPMSIVIALGWIIAKYAEPWTRNSILKVRRLVASSSKS